MEDVPSPKRIVRRPGGNRASTLRNIQSVHMPQAAGNSGRGKAGQSYVLPEGKLLPRQREARPLLHAVTSPHTEQQQTSNKDPHCPPSLGSTPVNSPSAFSKECIQNLQSKQQHGVGKGALGQNPMSMTARFFTSFLQSFLNFKNEINLNPNCSICFLGVSFLIS